MNMSFAKRGVHDMGSEMEADEEQRPHLVRELRNRHIQMIAIGGAVGGGLFIGSGSGLYTGGPGSLLIGFVIIGAMLLCTLQALGELAVMYPVNGAFFQYTARFISPAWGFAMGWNYAFGWLVTLPFELTAAGLTISYWQVDVSIGVWIGMFLFIVAVVQIFGVRGYGEVEFILSSIKIVACIGFIILGIIINCGGVSTDDRGYIGARYWHDPGAIRNGMKGFCSVFVIAAFAFGGTELVGLTAAEAKDPEKTLPKAFRQVFWRITFFYIINILIIGLIVPSNSDQLLAASPSNTKASPFVLAISMAGIKVLPSIFNTVITLSVISVANSCVYGSTRTLQALAEAKMAPKIFARIDSKGRPIWAIIIQLAFGLLAFISEAATGVVVLDWLMAITGLSSLFCWSSICFAHVRYRRAWKVQQRSMDDIPYKAKTGVVGSHFSLCIVVLCMAASFYDALFPIGGTPNAYDFFEKYLSGIVMIVSFVVWALLKKNWTMIIGAKDIELDVGRRYY